MLTLTRVCEVDDATLGMLVLPGVELLTLELPWRDNHQDISCIPCGTYHAVREYSNKLNYETFEFKDVPNRDEVKFHIANSASELLGCIALGLRFGRLNQAPAVLQSAIAFKRFMEVLNPYRAITVEIRQAWR